MRRGVGFVEGVDSTRRHPDEAALDVGERELMALLGNERRYACLQYLAANDEEDVHMRTLADALADELAEDPPASENLENSVYISLCQTHMPKLEAAGLVEYDAEAKSVACGPAFGSFERFGTAPSTPDVRPTVLVVCLSTSLLLFGTFALPPTFDVVVTAVLLVVNLGALGFVAASYR